MSFAAKLQSIEVQEVEEIATVMSDQASKNIDSINSFSSDLSEFDHESIFAEINNIRTNAKKDVLTANDSEQYSQRKFVNSGPDMQKDQYNECCSELSGNQIRHKRHSPGRYQGCPSTHQNTHC